MDRARSAGCRPAGIASRNSRERNTFNEVVEALRLDPAEGNIEKLVSILAGDAEGKDSPKFLARLCTFPRWVAENCCTDGENLLWWGKLVDDLVAIIVHMVSIVNESRHDDDGHDNVDDDGDEEEGEDGDDDDDEDRENDDGDDVRVVTIMGMRRRGRMMTMVMIIMTMVMMRW